VTDLDGRLRRVNPAFSRLFGWSEEELLGRTLAELAHPDNRQGVLAGVAKLAGGEPIIDSEVRGRCKDGSYRWLRCSGMPVPEERAIYVSIRDVSRRKSAEELLRHVFDDSPVGIAMVDKEQRILRANPALWQLLGYAEDELVGRRFAEVIHPDDIHLDTDLLLRLFAGEIPGFAIEKRYLRKGGEVVWGRLQTSIVHGEEGELLYRLAMVEDITEQREADAARREHEALKDAFVRVVAHDLQNPLVAIASLTGLLAEGPADLAPDEQRRILGRIAIHAERLKDTVASFLDLDRLRQGAVTVRRCPTDLAQLARRVAEACDRGDRLLSVEAAPVVAPVDPDMAEHILGNLLENAVTHTPPGTRLWIRIAQEPGGVTMAVEDAGPGMPDELKSAGFELFRTGDPNARRTGVGLWVVARLAELHGGQAWVEDRPGGGAAFRVLLPTGPPQDEPTS
jgi:two-component system CheB/CheR fusion protein